MTEDERFDTRDYLQPCDECEKDFDPDMITGGLCPDCWWDSYEALADYDGDEDF